MKKKAKFDAVMTLVMTGEDSVEEEESEEPENKITEVEKDSIAKTIEKYSNFKTGKDDPEKDKRAGHLMLKRFEDNARVTRDKFKKLWKARTFRREKAVK
jgi:hypothetical protein